MANLNYFLDRIMDLIILLFWHLLFVCIYNGLAYLKKEGQENHAITMSSLFVSKYGESLTVNLLENSNRNKQM